MTAWKATTWSWPRLVCLALALVPIGALGIITAGMALGSVRAVTQLGLGGLFSPELFIGNNVAERRYGLLAPLWGTVLVTAEAVLIALPVSLAIAVAIREYPMGIVSRALGMALGVLSGVPSLAYALLGAVFVETFVRPKFAYGLGSGSGAGLGEGYERASALWGAPVGNATLPAGGPVNSTFLGGLLLALLIIPFTAPLIEDAMRRVPRELKEASYALGAGRWHTLTRIVLPWALPGIVSAATLGALTAIGEVIIPIYVIGTTVNLVRLPAPLWDVFETVATPLASAGAGLMGGLSPQSGEGSNALTTSVASFAGLLLLLIAFGVMALATYVQRRLNKRLTQ